MANLLNKNGRFTVQFRLRPTSERATVALGKMAPEEAEVFRARITTLVEAHRADSPPDPSTAKWVNKLPDAIHAKLAKTGLVTAREAPATPTVPLLGPFVTDYIEKRKADTAQNTQINYRQARGYLVDYFGATRPMNKVTRGDAEDFRLDLLTRLSENTVRRVCGRAKQFFAAAIRHKAITENPFAGVKCSIMENRERDYFVSREEAAKVLEACPDAEWRVLFALSRYGGLRCPSEHLGLRWADIDWVGNRFVVRSPKTKHVGKASRVVPLFPELRPRLEELWDLAEPGEEYVITRYRGKNSNLRTQLERIIVKAGLTAWPKLFHNLRASRETELTAEYPIHVVCDWLGNTPAVAAKHYLQVRESDFERAAGCTLSPAALQMALQIPSEKRCNPMHADFRAEAGNLDDAPGCINSPLPALCCTDDQVPPRGVEPLFSD